MLSFTKLDDVAQYLSLFLALLEKLRQLCLEESKQTKSITFAHTVRFCADATDGLKRKLDVVAILLK